MKKIVLLFIGYLLAAFSLHAQNTSLPCHPSVTQQYAKLMSSDDFIKKHETPLPYVYEGKGEMVTFPTGDGQDGRGFFIKSTKPSNNYIFVFQEWWGLNDYIKRESEKLFNDLGNVNVLAIDLYDGKVTSDRDSAKILVTSFNPERGKTLINGALNFAGKKSKIGTIGWCFGGSWSLQASLLAEKQANACVIYYGMPEKDTNQLKKLQAEVLGIFASQDKNITPEVVKEFENNLKSINKKYSIKMYNADHAFANPSNPHFDKQSTEDAWKNTIAFFKKTMK